MPYEKLSPRERIKIDRALSQALYFAQRGFYDHCRVYAPAVPPEMRNILTSQVAQFLHAYVIGELAQIVADSHEREGLSMPQGTTRLAEFEPIARDTAPSIFDPTVPA